MKNSNKKSYINISDLIKGFDHNKQNQSSNVNNRSIGQQYSEVPIQKLMYYTKEKDKAFKNSKCSHRFQKRYSQVKALDTISSSKRIQQENFDQLFSLRPREDPKEVKAKNMKKLQIMQNLIVSQKMFIDPDRWQSFLREAQGDQKFHKALRAFLYSYFLQNYQ